LTDDEVVAELDQAWSDLGGSVAHRAGLRQMAIRWAVAQLQRTAGRRSRPRRSSPIQ
jgi:hypothetical protein